MSTAVPFPSTAFSAAPPVFTFDEAPMARLRRLAASFTALAAQPALPSTVYHDVLSLVHAMCAALEECERAGHDRAELLEVLAGVRRVHARSPFVRRLQSWPRGYPGDFETVQSICSGENRAAPGTIEHACEQYALNRSIAQQHRNKVRHQAERILRTMAAKPGQSRVLSIACGSSPDLAQLRPVLPVLAGELYLNDGDADALAFSREVVRGVESRCRFIHANALKAASRIDESVRFDLVLAGGLFDYLPARHASYLIAKVYRRLLANGGTFFFTNIATGNPYRTLIEYFGDWFLLERSEADVITLCTDAGVPANAIDIRRDETGLALLIEVRRG
jgi:extracellular factor (EF) 3-hydroxypalmitic acid methyl ester biosynthesis protein